MPRSEALPADLAWFAALNAFPMPEPPEHRAHLVQLAELVGSALGAAQRAPAPVFSVPSEGRMLRRGDGNIRFTETAVDSEMRRCSIDPAGQVVWLASDRVVEIRDLTTGALRHSARPGAAWLKATSAGAIQATSAIGYQAPDTISFAEISVRDGVIARADAGFTWSWSLPPIALSADETRLIAYIRTPDRRDVIVVSLPDRKEIWSCAWGDSSVLALCVDPAGARCFALATEGGRLVLSAVDVPAGSRPWSSEMPTEQKRRGDACGVTFWRGPGMLLVNTGTSLFEVDASTGEIGRTLMTGDRELRGLATDPSTSLAGIAEGTSLRLWMPGAESFLTVDLSGDACRDCSLQNGTIAVLVGTDARCRLLTASTSGPSPTPA